MNRRCVKCSQPRPASWFRGSSPEVCVECLMKEAGKARDDGIRRSVNHADEEYALWSERAYEALERFPGTEFMIEDVRRWAEDLQGLPPSPDPRAWGAIARRAVVRGLIRRVGFSDSKNVKAHRRPTAIWRRRGAQIPNNLKKGHGGDIDP